MSVKMIDEITKYGTIPLTRIKDVFAELSNLIENAGNFILTKELSTKQKSPKIASFLNECHFMQT